MSGGTAKSMIGPTAGNLGEPHEGEDHAGTRYGRVWMLVTLWGLRTAASSWNIPNKYGRLGELFFFLIKKEPTNDEKTADGACIGRRSPAGPSAYTKDCQCFVLTCGRTERPTFRPSGKCA